MKIYRCIHCMEEMGAESAVCPHCGKGQAFQNWNGSVRPNTILHGRYLAGLRTETDDACIAFDLATGNRVYIKESPAIPDGDAAVTLGQGSRGQTVEVFQENGTFFSAFSVPEAPGGAHGGMPQTGPGEVPDRVPDTGGLDAAPGAAMPQTGPGAVIDPVPDTDSLARVAWSQGVGLTVEAAGFPPQMPPADETPQTCPHCHYQWNTPTAVGKPRFCPNCGKALKLGFKLPWK